jgi:hypothetical protein
MRALAPLPEISAVGHGIRMLGQWSLDSSVFSTLGSGESGDPSGGGRLTGNCTHYVCTYAHVEGRGARIGAMATGTDRDLTLSRKAAAMSGSGIKKLLPRQRHQVIQVQRDLTGLRPWRLMWGSNYGAKICLSISSRSLKKNGAPSLASDVTPHIYLCMGTLADCLTV